VGVFGDTTLYDKISHNSIYAHASLGIELLNGGNTEPTPPAFTSVAENTITGIAPALSMVEAYANCVDEGQYSLGSLQADAFCTFVFD